MNIAIIGGGVAGCAAAYFLKRYGLHTKIYERESTLAQGASGNNLGLVNPRFYAHKTPQSEYYAQSFLSAITFFDSASGAPFEWIKSGALHLVTDDKKARRFPQTCQNWGWGADKMRMVDAAEASEISGIKLHHDALYLAESGSLNPAALCDYLASGAEIITTAEIKNLNELNADVIVIACAAAASTFSELAFLPIKTVRGQMTQIKAPPELSGLCCNLNYGGYCAPARGDVQTIGATFQPWLNHSDIIAQDDAENISMLSAILPSGLERPPEILSRRASVRASVKDHLPVVGRYDAPNINAPLYLSLAHGSHGIISALGAGQVIAAQFTENSLPLFTQETLDAVSPYRFI